MGSIYDDGTDLGLPATEARGGEKVPWDQVQAGQPLPEPVPEPDDELGGEA